VTGHDSRATFIGNRTTRGDVYIMAAQRWRMVRVPERLAQRLDELAEAMMKAHVEGRIILPASMCEQVPIWAAIESAVDHQEAKRARSRRPRTGRTRAASPAR
jgi:hypothetical protein